MNVSKLVQGVLLTVIGLVILMTMLGETVDDVQTAGDTVNTTGAPLSGMFASDSIVPLIFLGAGLLAVIALAFKMMKG